jgi:hypothetical protein
MNSTDYSVDEEEQNILNTNANDCIVSIREGNCTPQEFKDILRLLETNKNSFENFKAETWFKKAWFVVSGKRGKLSDITLTNLGKVQIGVLKIVGEILNDISGIKDDILSVLSRVEKIQEQSMELKAIILKFNSKYERSFKKLQKDIEQTNWSLRISQIILGICLVSGSAIVFMPGLSSAYWHIGLILGTLAGVALIAQFLFGSLNRKGSAIPVQDSKNIHILPQKRLAISQTCQFLGIGKVKQNIFKDNRIFKVNNQVIDLIDYFKLNVYEQQLLFSIEHFLCQSDIDATNDEEKRSRKASWLKDWKNTIESQLKEPIVKDAEMLFKGLSEISTEHISIPKMGTLLFETAIFTPYFALEKNQNIKDLTIDKENRIEQIKKISRSLVFSMNLILEAEKLYENALKTIPSKGLLDSIWGALKENPILVLAGAILIAVTGGLAAPIIGGTIGTMMGLSGAVAVKAGLAFVGGGAIAAGGMGMAGGTAVLIGGGAILGTGTTLGLVNLFSNSNHLVLRELAKLEAISKAFMCTLPNGQEVIERIIDYEKETALELSRASLNAKSEKNSKLAKEIDAGQAYCLKAIERLQECIRKEYCSK